MALGRSAWELRLGCNSAIYGSSAGQYWYQHWDTPTILSAVGFLRVVMIPMFVSSRMALSPLPPEVLGGQRPFWGRQERSVCLQRRDGRPGLWDKAPHGERRLIEQRHQDEGPAPAKDAHEPQTGGTPHPRLRG